MVKWFAFAAMLFFAFITLMSCSFDKPDSQWTGLLTGSLVTFGSGLFWLDCLFRRLVYDDYRLIVFSFWGNDQQLAWEDISDISYSPLCQWFVLRTRQGPFRAYEFMSGIREFLDFAKDKGLWAPPVLRA